jgi:hypothetical protein
LRHATPQQKPAIIHELGATNDLIDQAEAALPAGWDAVAPARHPDLAPLLDPSQHDPH